MVPAPTSVLWGSQMAQPTDAQYAWRRAMASWKEGASGRGEDVGGREADVGASTDAALVRKLRERGEEVRCTGS